MRRLHNFFISLGLVGYVTYFLLYIVLLIGGFLNIGKLVGLRHSDEITVEIIIRIIDTKYNWKVIVFLHSLPSCIPFYPLFKF